MRHIGFQRRGRGGYLGAIIAVAALLVAACSGGSAAQGNGSGGEVSAPQGTVPPATDTVKIGHVPKGPEWGFLGMAGRLGLFEKYGVEVEFVTLQSAAEIYPALFSGEVDAVYQSPGGLFAAAKQGQVNARVIGSAMHGLPWAIYGSSGTTSLEDISGKTMAISSPTGLPALVANEMLRAAGVDPQSMRFVNAGGNADRYRAVVAGEVDAASSAANYIPQADKEGVKVLGRSWEIVPKFPRLMIIARDDALQANPGGFSRYLAALIEGIRYAFDHPEEARELAVEASGRKADDPVIDFTLDLIREEKMISSTAEIKPKKLRFLMDVLVRNDMLDKPLDVADFKENSYRQRALKLLEGSQ